MIDIIKGYLKETQITGHNIQLTKLVDGIKEYTLGEEVFNSFDEAFAHWEEKSLNEAAEKILEKLKEIQDAQS